MSTSNDLIPPPTATTGSGQAPKTPPTGSTGGTPSTYELNGDQVALVRTLTSPSEFDLSHAMKVAEDVATAFGGTVLATVEGSAKLGGDDRVKTIQGLLDQEQKLAAISTLLGQIARLVDQNLFLVRGQLGEQVSELVKLVDTYKKSDPGLSEGLAAARDWVKLYHPGRAPKKAPAEKK